MLNHALMASFRDELEKQAAVPLPVALGAAGAIGAGGYALSTMVDDFKKDQFLYDMKQMPEDVYRMRKNRRLYLAGSAAALGGTAGAMAPMLGTKLREFASRKLRSAAGHAGEVVKEKGREAAREGVNMAGQAGRAFAEEAVNVGSEAAEDMGAKATKGAYEQAQRMGGFWGLRGSRGGAAL
jgi:hypothetical protein